LVEEQAVMEDVSRKRAQQPSPWGDVTAEFDASRAVLSDEDTFPPFDVKAARPLREALARGDVRDDTLVLAIERDEGTLALLTQQMAHHHVAQGEIAGEAWLVSF
jgi:hypothetical protein